MKATPSPENVRPITGWDGVTVNACGKNLFANQKGSKSYIGLKAGITYTISYHANTNAYFRGIDENGSYITGIIWIGTGVINERRYGSITPSIDIPYGMIYRSAGLSEAQIEVGSEVTSYEPYEPTTLTIPFNRTIYGGYVDLVKGEVVETWHKMTINDSSRVGIFPWGGVKTDSATGIEYVSALFLRESIDSKAYNRRDNMCDKLPYNTNQNHINTAYVYDGDSYGPCISLSTALIGTTQETLKQYLNGNPFNFCYQIRTPITYSIDPQTLKALRGMNNIWSDANGNIEVSYYTH